MPVAPNGILQAEYDPQWATTSLIVDGGMWPSAVVRITIVRSVAGVSDITVRGVDRRPVVGGYFIGSDPEMPLDSTVTYTVTGYSAAGAVVGTSTVSVDTSGAACGAWLKVAGQPNLTIRAELAEVGEVDSTTQGGVYDIAGGGVVATSVAEANGINADRLTLGIRGTTDQQARAIRTTLQSRILLIQSCSHEPFDPGWYFVASVKRSLRTQMAKFPGRNFSLELVRTGIPSGVGQGIAGLSWAGVMDTYPTWAAVQAAEPSWWDLMQGVS